jgi:hypothetical protein
MSMFGGEGIGNINLEELARTLAPVYEQFGIAPPDPMPGVTPTPVVPGIVPGEGTVSNEKNLANTVVTTDPEDTTPAVTYDAYTEYLKQQDEANKSIVRQDARLLLGNSLKNANLESLTGYVFELIAQDKLTGANADVFEALIQDRPEYQTRFAGNAGRIAKGLPKLDMASYIALETSYRDTMRANGIPERFYDKPDDFAKLIEGDVSPQEMQKRVEDGFAAVKDADPEVVRQMQALYGVTEPELAAYFIDPQRMKPELDGKQLARQAQAAKIAARSVEQGGINVSGEAARVLYEDLATRGFTQAQIMAGFEEIGKLGELKVGRAGEAELSQQDIVQQQFGVNMGAQAELERRKRLRLGEFQGGGTFARATGDVAGSTQLGIGTAQ